MSQGGTGGHRRIRTALALSLLVSAALIAQPTVAGATTDGLSFGEVAWAVDPAAGTATFSVQALVTSATVPGAPCARSCALVLFGSWDRPDGRIAQTPPLGGVKLPWTPAPDARFTGSGANPEVTHLELRLVSIVGPSVMWTSGRQEISTLVAKDVVVVPGVTDDLLDHLVPFLAGLDWERVDDTVELAEDMTVVTNLAATVCTAAEGALERPGGSKGKRLGTISEADMAVATLCALLADVAGTPVPEAVEDVLSLTLPPRGKPEGAGDVPGNGNGLDKDADVEGEG